MNTIKISDDTIQREDGSILERSLLSQSSCNEDYSATYHRNKPGILGPILFFGGLLVLATTSQVDPEEIQQWPLGGATVPISIFAVVLGAILAGRKIMKSRSIPHMVISVTIDDRQTTILRTNDKEWGQSIASRLTQLEHPSSGNWTVNAREKSIVQE